MAAVLAVGGLLDALSNSLSWIAPETTYFGTVILLLCIPAANLVLRRRPVDWVIRDRTVRITRLGVGPTVAILGIAALLWAPRLVEVWTPTRDETIAEFRTLIDRKEWDALSARLQEIQNDPGMTDVWLYFRGALLHNTRPTQIDPEQMLSLVPPSSDLYMSAQGLRLSNWSQSPNKEQLRKRIVQSLEEANSFIAMYYSLRLIDQGLSYAQVSELFDDFKRRKANLFDFDKMGFYAQIVAGQPVNIDLIEAMRVEAATVFFLARLIETAYRECLRHQVSYSLALYDRMLAHEPDGHFDLELESLAINPAIQREIERIRNAGTPADCH